jgi:hypothetical protein
MNPTTSPLLRSILVAETTVVIVEGIKIIEVAVPAVEVMEVVNTTKIQPNL